LENQSVLDLMERYTLVKTLRTMNLLLSRSFPIVCSTNPKT